MIETIILKDEDSDAKSSSSVLSKQRVVQSVKIQPEEQVFPSLRDEMKAIKRNFVYNAPDIIITPFQGTALVVTQNPDKYIFSSKEGRIAICDAKTKAIILDKDVKETSIWNLALYAKNSIILTGGSDGVIRKLDAENLNQMDIFRGHDNEINYIVVSPDEKWAFSGSDDCTVRRWSLLENNPTSQLLYSHQGNVYGMDMSLDGTYLSTVGSDGILIVYRSGEGFSDSNTVLKKTSASDSMLWISKFSPDNSLVAAGSEDSNTYIWNTRTWELIRTLKGHTARVRCMNFTHNGQKLITGGIDNKIMIWDIQGVKDPLSLEYHNGWVRATIISPDNQYCTSLGDDCKIITWKIPDFDREIMLKSDSSIIAKMWTSLDSSTIFGVTETFIVKSWNALSGVQQTEFHLGIPQIVYISVAYTLSSINVFTAEPNPEDSDSPNTKVQQISAVSGAKESECIIGTSDVTSAYASSDGKFLIIGTMYTLDIYTSNMQLYHSFKAHSAKVISISTTSNNDYLFSSDGNAGVIMFSIYGKSIEKKLLLPSDKNTVMQVKVSRNDQYLFVTHLMYVEIYSIALKSKLYSIREPGIKHISFSMDCTKIFVFDRNNLNIYNTENFSLFYSQKYRAPTSYITFATDGSYYVLYRGSISKIVPNPLLIKTHACLGKYDEIDNYEVYVISIIRDKVDKHIRSFDSMVIMPNYMNTLHFYAYYNHPELLKIALENDAPFYASRSGHTPLSIALELKYLGCVRAIIKGMSLRLQENRLNFYYFERSMADLNNLGYGGLHQIYSLMFGQSFNRALPKFSIVKVNDLYREGANILINPIDFMPEDNFSKDGTSITFKQSYCKFPLVPGSEKSLEFMESLVDCKNTKVYDTQLVHLILKQKYKKLRWINNMQALFYMSFCLTLAIYTVNYLNDKSFILIPLGIEAFLLLYELIQICINRLAYFKDLLNWVDLGEIVLFGVYFLRVELSYTSNQELLSVVIFVSLFRGITYFRLFSDTRYYINLLFEVFVDVIPFLIIVYYASIGFGMIFLSLDRGGNNVFTDYLIWTYPLDIGAYPQDNFTDEQLLNYFIATLLIKIVMFSLVVSILGNTFKRVNEHSIVADSQAIAQMVYESELLFFWNRKKNQTSFVFLCSEKEEKAIDKADINKKVRKLKTFVTALGKKINGNKRMMRNMSVKFTETSKSFIKSLTGID